MGKNINVLLLTCVGESNCEVYTSICEEKMKQSLVVVAQNSLWAELYFIRPKHLQIVHDLSFFASDEDHYVSQTMRSPFRALQSFKAMNEE